MIARMRNRCGWVNVNNELYVKYHDEEWGVPQHDDQKLFEMLILEGAQAGLSWETVLNKRDNYRIAFDGFDPVLVSGYNDEKIAALLKNDGIIRNRLKIRSAVKNARVFLKIQQEFGSFDKYIWSFTDGKIIVNSFKSLSEIPSETALSDLISKDLNRRGMNFVGSTIVYAYMQSIGVVNDHVAGCYKYLGD